MTEAERAEYERVYVAVRLSADAADKVHQTQDGDVLFPMDPQTEQVSE